MENACAYNYPLIAQREGVRHVIQEEFGQFKNEIVNELDNILSFNRMENSFDNHAETRELIKKIDELKVYLNDLEKSCDSLFHVLKSFK